MSRATKKSARSDGLTGGGALSTPRARRLGWLLAHSELWTGAPSDTQDVDDEGRAILIAIGQQMAQAGLYSKAKNVSERNWGIRVLLGEARKRLAVQP